MSTRWNTMGLLVPAFAVSITAGCVQARVTPFDPALAASQRTPPERIRFHDLKRPECPFDEIGRITAQTGPFVSWGRVVATAREKASQMGGDAIVRVSESTKVSGAVIIEQTISATEHTTLSGTVVRFRDPACTK